MHLAAAAAGEQKDQISLRGLRQRQVHHGRFALQAVAGLVKARSSSRRSARPKQLSAQAAEMPYYQPARGGPRAGEHNEARVVKW